MKMRNRIFAALTAAVSLMSLSTAMPAHAADKTPDTTAKVLTAQDISVLKQMGATDELIAKAMTPNASAVQHYADYYYNKVPVTKPTKYNAFFYGQFHPGVKKYDMIPGFAKISSFELDTSAGDKTTLVATVTLEEDGCFCIARHIYDDREYVAPTTAADSRTTYDVLVGDVNMDGIVDVGDTVLIAQYIANDPTALISEFGQLAADVNLDGKIDLDDYNLMLLFNANIIDTFWEINDHA